jgi:hypothetical protein
MRGCTGTPLRGPRRERQLWQPGRRPRVRLREPPRQESAVALSACPRARRPGCPRSLCAGGCQREPWPRTAAAPLGAIGSPECDTSAVFFAHGHLVHPHILPVLVLPVAANHTAGCAGSPRCVHSGAATVQGPLAPQAVGARRPRSVAGWGTRLRRVLLRWQAPQPCRFRRGRAFWRTLGPRRLRRQSQPGLAATQGGQARPGSRDVAPSASRWRSGHAPQAVAAVEVPQLLERALLDRAACFLRPNRTGPCCEQRETDPHRRR